MGLQLRSIKGYLDCLLNDDMMGSLELILEWAILGIGIDITECFEEEDDSHQYGLVPFLQWSAKVDKLLMFQAAKTKRLKDGVGAEQRGKEEFDGSQECLGQFPTVPTNPTRTTTKNGSKGGEGV